MECKTLMVSRPAQRWKAGAGELPHAPLHAIFQHQILRRLDNVQEAVDPRIDQRGVGRCQLGIFQRQIIGFCQRVD
jgi:hypothetical protein